MEKKVSRGLIGLFSLSIAGNFLISLPLTSDDGSDILGAVLAVIFSFLTVIFIYPWLSKLFLADICSARKTVNILLSVIYIFIEAVLIYIAVATITRFSQFVSSQMLPQVHISVIFLVFAVSAVLITRSQVALSKIATVLLFVTLLLVLTIFMFSIPKMSLKYIVPTGFPNIYTSLKTAFVIYLKSFAEAFIAVAVISSRLKSKKSLVIGNALGSGIVLLCILNTLLVFGGGFASTLNYPYTAAVSTVAMGDMFSGMDGFLYVTIILTCIIKTSLLFYAIGCLASKISDCYYQPKKKFN